MNRNSLKFKNICITDSLYSLLIFMLISESKISETFFIFGNSININKEIFKDNSILTNKIRKMIKGEITNEQKQPEI